MSLKLNSSSGSITISPEDGSGNVDVTFPRSGVPSVASISVTVSGGNFLLDGTANQKARLTPSVTYRFDQSNSSNSGHPLLLSTTSDGTHGGGSAFTTGVTTVGTAGSSGSYVEVTLEQDAPYDLYYYCSNHSGMGGGIEVSANNSLTDFSVTASATELNVLDGIPSTLTATELGYVDGVTSAIQTQLDAKVGASYTGDVDITGELLVDSYNETYVAVTSSSNTTTIDCEAGNAFSHTLTENTTLAFSNEPASGTAFSFSLEIIQDASASGYTVTFPTEVDWPSATTPTLTATASAKDVFVFYTRDGGTNWYGFTAGQALG
tara:strand:+ start:8953 stop:9915 length:963 start_codon:yes stop_codon:yes gene_type:complete